MLVEYQPATPIIRALRPGAMIVLISVWPVFMSLPHDGRAGLLRQFLQRRNLRAQVRRRVARTECLRLIAA